MVIDGFGFGWIYCFVVWTEITVNKKESIDVLNKTSKNKKPNSFDTVNLIK